MEEAASPLVQRLLSLALVATACHGGQATSTPPRPEPPKPVCLVLSVGAHNGLSHIGVVNALIEQGVEIKCVVGTSMGSLVGGLYASAPNAELGVRYSEFAKAYVQATESDVGGGLFTGLLLGVLVGAATGGVGAALAVGGVTGGAVGAGSVDLKSLQRMERVLDDYLGHVGVQETALPYGTLSQSLEMRGAKLEPKETGSLAEAIIESISNPLIFPNVKVAAGERIDPGSDPTAAIPLRYACERFNNHQFVISNVSGGRVIDEKDMTCDWVEVKPERILVSSERAMRAYPAEIGALIREGRRAAFEQLDFEKLGGGRPTKRGLQCEKWAISQIAWTMPPNKDTGEDWDGDGSAPDVVVRIEVGENLVLSGPKTQAYSGSWLLPQLVPFDVGAEVSVWAFDVDAWFDDRGVSETIVVPSDPSRGATSEHFAASFVCVE